MGLDIVERPAPREVPGLSLIAAGVLWFAWRRRAVRVARAG
jgi:hypothetical protein